MRDTSRSSGFSSSTAARSRSIRWRHHRALELDGAHEPRSADHQPAQFPQLPAVQLGLHAARDGLQLLPALQGLAVLARDFLGGPHEFQALLLHQLVGEDGIGDLDYVARRDRVARHLLAHAR